MSIRDPLDVSRLHAPLSGEERQITVGEFTNYLRAKGFGRAPGKMKVESKIGHEGKSLIFGSKSVFEPYHDTWYENKVNIQS